MAVTNLLGALALDTTAQAILTKLGDLATSAGLATLGGKLDTIASKLATTLQVDGSAVTQPVTAASLPLPEGAATDATVAVLGGKLDATNLIAGERTSTGEEVVMLLESILSRLGYPDPGQGSLRVSIMSGNVGINGGTITVGQMAGFSTAYDQHAAMGHGAQAIRNRITVT